MLEEIAANAEVFTCTADTTEPCDTVDCSAFDLYTAEFVLLPCRTPPAIRIVINQEETPVLDETIDRSRVIVVPQLLGLVLNITLDQFEDAIGLQVCVHTYVIVFDWCCIYSIPLCHSRKSARPKALCHPKKESSLNVLVLLTCTCHAMVYGALILR